MLNKTNDTHGIGILKGDSKLALRKLALPLMISVLLVSLYNIVDSIWVAGLGADALTAIGFIIPVQYVIIGLGTGLGAGINAVISRYLGKKDINLANNAAFHSLLISIIISIISTIVFISILRPLYIFMGASGLNLELAMDFSKVYFLGCIVVILPQALYGLLRAEGDVNRTMYAMGICAVLNVILDPIFIYVLNWGIAGAAYATLISMLLVCIIIFYWIYIKNDTYLRPLASNFQYNSSIIRDILNVGLPASIEFLVMSIVGIIINLILLMVSGSDAVAVYQNGWRLISFAIEPLAAIGMALVTVVGFNYGARNFKKIEEVFDYSIKLSTFLGIIFAVLLVVFRYQFAYLFAYSATSARLLEPLSVFLIFFGLAFIFFPVGMVSTFIFQGFGKGLTSLLLTIIREALCAVLFSYLFGVVLNMGLNGVWLGNFVGYAIGAIIALLYAKLYMKRLKKYIN